MSHAVFLRSVNVGGHKTFKPSQFAKELARLGVTSLGAAGSFVVTGKISPSALRAEFQRKLPFETEIMVCPGKGLVELIRRRPFGDGPPGKDEKRVVSILARPPRVSPAVPFARPPGADWEVRVLGVDGPFVPCLYRRRGRAVLYPNVVVEKSFGVPATTRAWNTIAAVVEALGAVAE